MLLRELKGFMFSAGEDIQELRGCVYYSVNYQWNSEKGNTQRKRHLRRLHGEEGT